MLIPQPATKLAVEILSIAGSVDTMRVSEMTTKIMREPRSSSSPSVLADDLHAGPIAPRLSFGGEDAAINHNRPLTVHYPLG
jgi:hypothetical protein